MRLGVAGGGGGDVSGGSASSAPSLSRDDCRRTLRRLELEAYASIVSVLRAQGHLRDERRKLLESARAALHIGSDRHQAEARRASNDQLLAAIAEQLSGPNTGLDWAREGRRKIPIFPRGIPQTAYTAIADRAALCASEENSAIAQRVADRKASLGDENFENSEDNVDDACNKSNAALPPVVTTDQSLKVMNDDGPPRKRSRSDAPVQHRISHQKHLDLSQIYTCYSKSHGKASNQYRNVYNQRGKEPKSNHSNLSKSNLSKHRSIQNKHATAAKHYGQVTIPHHQVRSGIKSPTDPHIAGSQALCIQNQVDAQTMKSQTPAFQASYAQPPAQNSSEEQNPDIKMNIGTTILESPTMQLLTQPSNNQNTSVSSPMQTEDTPVISSSVQDTTTITISSNVLSPKIQTPGKACHFIIKKKSDITDSPQIAQKIQFSNKPILSKADLGNLKVLQNRQVVVSPSNNTQKILNSSGKLITTKIVQHIPQKPQAQINPNTISSTINSSQVVDKLLIMPKPPTSVQSIQRSLCSTPLKNIYISSHSPMKEGDANSLVLKSNDPEILSKGLLLNNDVKLPTKTFLLNSKSGHKMVVLPTNKRPKAVIGQPVPLVMKGLPGKQTMKLIPLTGQSVATPSKTNVAMVKSTSGNVLGTPTKILPKDSIPLLKTNPASDSNLPKVISNIQITSKNTLQSLKHPIPAKGNVIVVQKVSTMSKTPITLTKNVVNPQKQNITALNESLPSDLSSDITLPEAAHEDVISRDSGNLVVLEMNEHMQHGICLPEEFIDEVGDESMTQSSMELKSDQSLITEETPGLFTSQITEEECNPDSMESTTDSLIEASNVDMKSNESSSEEPDIHKISSEKELLSDKTVHLSDFTTWETELVKPEESKNISDKSDELTLELEMSTDSEGDYTVTEGRSKGGKQLMQEDGSQDEQEDPNEMFAQHSSISQARRTLLSQLQDDGSSSNDSPFLLSKNLETARLELLETSQTSSSAME